MPRKAETFAQKLERTMQRHNRRQQKNMELFLAEQRRQGKKLGEPIDLMQMITGKKRK